MQAFSISQNNISSKTILIVQSDAGILYIMLLYAITTILCFAGKAPQKHKIDRLLHTNRHKYTISLHHYCTKALFCYNTIIIAQQ